MKTEMMTVSFAGALSLFTAGVLVGVGFYSAAWPMLLIAAAMLAYVREDAREIWLPGVWTRGKLFWTRTGPTP